MEENRGPQTPPRAKGDASAAKHSTPGLSTPPSRRSQHQQQQQTLAADAALASLLQDEARALRTQMRAEYEARAAAHEADFTRRSEALATLAAEREAALRQATLGCARKLVDYVEAAQSELAASIEALPPAAPEAAVDASNAAASHLTERTASVGAAVSVAVAALEDLLLSRRCLAVVAYGGSLLLLGCAYALGRRSMTAPIRYGAVPLRLR